MFPFALSLFSQKDLPASATEVGIAEDLEGAVPLSQSQKGAGVTGLLFHSPASILLSLVKNAKQLNFTLEGSILKKVRTSTLVCKLLVWLRGVLHLQGTSVRMKNCLCHCPIQSWG